MPPQHGAHLWKAIQNLKKSFRITQPDGLHPRTADRYGVVVQAHQMVPLRCFAQ
jgi:hypothetical protein